MKFNILIDGQAGQGPNALSKMIGKILARLGYYVFVSRDYGSFIRGGCNSNIVTFSDRQIMSNSSTKDILVILGKESKCKEGKGYHIVLKGEEDNMYFAGMLAKLFNINFDILREELRSLGNFDKNLASAKRGFNNGKTKFQLKTIGNSHQLYDGSKGVADGAVKSGLDVYFAYPMTPATPLLNELAESQIKNNHFVFELENEISVINAAIGASITGAKSMIGTSGGGFDLMTEALSLTGQAEVPLVIYLAQRLGPSTGAATYTSQGDLKMVLGAGHGEFPRLVLAPGDPVESAELTSEAFYFSQKYKIPCFIISDKHLAESLYSISGIPRIKQSDKLAVFGRYNSYEHDSTGSASDSSHVVKANAEKRMVKQKEIDKDAENFEMFKIHGDEKSKNLVLFWGSTKGAVLDAIAGLNVKAMQIKYLEPFPVKIRAELQKAKKVIVVENNATSQLSSLIAEKTGILIEDKNKILKYDGRPFFSDELAGEIKGRLR